LRRYNAGDAAKRHAFYSQHKEEWVRDMGTLRPDIQGEWTWPTLWDQFKTAWAVNGQLKPRDVSEDSRLPVRDR